MTTRARARWAAAVVATLLAAACPAGQWLVLERRVADPDAIVALASHEHERLPAAWQLALDHPRAVVVLSQPAEPSPWNCQDCAHRVDRLVGWGVGASRVHVMDTPVRNSHDELAAARVLALERGWTRLQVVTSPYHARRVVGLIRDLDGDGQGGGDRLEWGVTTAAAEPIRPWAWWSRRYDRRYVVYELGAMAANSWRYGIWPWAWWAAL